MPAKNIITEFLASYPKARIRDLITVESKCKTLIDGGLERLLIISDFDHTLSRHVYNGQRACTTHGVFESAKDPESYGLTKQMQQELISMTKKYLQIEFCPKMSIEEKIPYMVEWWSEGHRKIIERNLSRQAIEKVATASTIFLRENAFKFLRRTCDNDVPFILFSAGIGDVIKCVIRRELGDWMPNMHLISNLMVFDENDMLVDFTEPIIHTFNKNTKTVGRDSHFREEVAGRSNVILLGDSPGDVHMDVGFEKEESVVLRIGFLNKPEAEVTNDGGQTLDKYLREYDIVIVDDVTFDAPLGALERLIDAIRANNTRTSDVLAAIRVDNSEKSNAEAVMDELDVGRVAEGSAANALVESKINK